MKKLLLSLFLVGSSGLMAQTWTIQNPNLPVADTYIGDISIVSANVAWGIVQRTGTTAATNYQTYTKTTNGGNAWNSGPINIGNTTTLGIANITAADANTAWVSVFPITGTSANQGVFKTTDGGTTWTRQASAAFTTASFVNYVHFWDANNGMCMGDKRDNYFEIYTTTNGGTTWTRTPSANIAATPGGDYSYTNKAFVVGNTVWFGTDNGKLLRSTDRGLNWTVINTPLTDFGGLTDPSSRGEFAFRDDNTGVIQELESQTLYVTTNGGTTWAPTSATGAFWGSIGYAGTVLVSGGSSTGNFGSSYSTNNGTSFTGIDVDSHTSLKFLDANTGWGGGFETMFKYNNTLSTADFAAGTFKAYPNPAGNTLNISVADIDSYQLAVTDLTGKTVMQKNLSGMDNTIDISNLSSGAYFFTMSADGKKETVKILKK